MERMRLMLKAKEREWSTHGNEIKELIKQTDEEVERWVKEAENEYKRKHAHD
jgi:gas vesicle protein